MSRTFLGFLTPAEAWGLAAGGALLLALCGIGIRMYRRKRPTPQEIERRRRENLEAIGKMGDGMVVEMHETVIVYSYAVRGVEYTASQDIADLENLMPAIPWNTIGPVAVKYDPRNPANSIVICEQWTGLRANKHPRG